MAKVKINRKRCKGCKLCILFCPKKNLKVDEAMNESGLFPAAVINIDDCSGCGFCYVMCPEGCIEIEIADSRP